MHDLCLSIHPSIHPSSLIHTHIHTHLSLSVALPCLSLSFPCLSYVPARRQLLERDKRGLRDFQTLQDLFPPLSALDSIHLRYTSTPPSIWKVVLGRWCHKMDVSVMCCFGIGVVCVASKEGSQTTTCFVSQ
mmetsp:Transcript_19971/g.48473  ORF Transcript_19971/g.48473 Transcript_19971/m.48473 type:complete len:132 (-) Transcript_19971:111-506(-)